MSAPLKINFQTPLIFVNFSSHISGHVTTNTPHIFAVQRFNSVVGRKPATAPLLFRCLEITWKVLEVVRDF